MSDPAEPAPLFRVVRGTPTATELAALVGAALLRSRPTAPAPAPAASLWTRSARPGATTASGLPARVGPNGWRTPALPR